MPKTKSNNNVYSLECVVTKKTIKTNPKQFNDFMLRFGLSKDEVISTYICREGRNIIKENKMTAQQMVKEYNIHPSVANNLARINKTARLDADTISPPQNESTPKIEVELDETEIENTRDVTDENDPQISNTDLKKEFSSYFEEEKSTV